MLSRQSRKNWAKFHVMGTLIGDERGLFTQILGHLATKILKHQEFLAYSNMEEHSW